MVFSQRELATVLAALRFWARTGISDTPLEQGHRIRMTWPF